MTIKFRAKAVIDGRWVYGYFRKKNGKSYICEYIGDPSFGMEWTHIEVDEKTVGMFICEPNDDGQDFYVGDLVVSRDAIDRGEGGYDDDIFELFYSDEDMSFMARSTTRKGYEVYVWELKDGEVVGDIYNNERESYDN